MAKLNKQEYILKAAKLYGLGSYEIEALKNHLDGSDPNDFIERKTKFLFRLYDIYKNEDGEKIKINSQGIIDLNDFSFEKSKRRLADSKIGLFWVIGANLDCFLATLPANKSNNIKSKFKEISEKNNFLLPQIAKSMGLPTVTFFKARFKPNDLPKNTYYLTKDFLKEADDTFIQGEDVLKNYSDKRRIKFENLLELTDKYIKKHYKKHKISETETTRARDEIRKGLIKQSFFNKYVFNENESNEKWGLIEDGNHNLRLAPLYSFDCCCGAEPTGKVHRRNVNGKEDIQTFMLKYGKEHWFREWIEEKVVPINDIDALAQNVQEETKVTLSDEEKEYYDFMFEQFRNRVREIVDIGFDEKEISKGKRVKNRIFDLTEIFSNKKVLPIENSDKHDER